MKKIFILLTTLLCITACGQSFDTEPNTSNQGNTTITEINKNNTRIKREKVKIKKFFDFQCKYCKQSVSTMKDLDNTYGKRVEIQYYHYPTKPGSALLAEAAECARDQDKFVDFRDTYFTNYFGKNDQKTIQTISKNLEMDVYLFTTCLESGVKKSVIESDMREGRKYGLTAVPFFVIENQVLAGSYPKSAFDKIIRHELTD